MSLLSYVYIEICRRQNINQEIGVKIFIFNAWIVKDCKDIFV